MHLQFYREDGLACVYDRFFASDSGGLFTPDDLFKEVSDICKLLFLFCEEMYII